MPMLEYELTLASTKDSPDWSSWSCSHASQDRLSFWLSALAFSLSFPATFRFVPLHMLLSCLTLQADLGA